MDPFLDHSQRAFLRMAHKAERDGAIRDRIRAVVLVDKGCKIPDIAEALFVDEQTVRRHVRDYLDRDKLGGGSGGPKGRLDEEQTQKLLDFLDASDVPTAADAAERARKILGAKFSVSGMTSWLKAHGFSFKKCEPLPAKADPGKQAEFVAQYRALKAGLPKGEAIFFLDACHPTRATKLGYSWSRKGVRKTIPTRPTRERLTVVGSLDAAAMRLVTTFPEKADGTSLAQHLAKLRRLNPQLSTIHLVLDNGSYCRSQRVKEAAGRLNIQLHFLPPYSPNLNLIERLWRLMNEEVRNNVSFESANDFADSIKRFFQKRWAGLSKTCRALFADNFQGFENPRAPAC